MNLVSFVKFEQIRLLSYYLKMFLTHKNQPNPSQLKNLINSKKISKKDGRKNLIDYSEKEIAVTNDLEISDETTLDNL